MTAEQYQQSASEHSARKAAIESKMASSRNKNNPKTPPRRPAASAALPKPVSYYSNLYKQSLQHAVPGKAASAMAALNELAQLKPKQLEQIPELKAESDTGIQKALYGATPQGGDYTPQERQKDAKKRTPIGIIRNRLDYAKKLQWSRDNQGMLNDAARRNQSSAKPNTNHAFSSKGVAVANVSPGDQNALNSLAKTGEGGYVNLGGQMNYMAPGGAMKPAPAPASVPNIPKISQAAPDTGIQKALSGATAPAPKVKTMPLTRILGRPDTFPSPSKKDNIPVGMGIPNSQKPLLGETLESRLKSFDRRFHSIHGRSPSQILTNPSLFNKLLDDKVLNFFQEEALVSEASYLHTRFGHRAFGNNATPSGIHGKQQVEPKPTTKPSLHSPTY